MRTHKVVVYYSWSRPAETEAPLTVIENRFPALFESRRMLYPRFTELSDPARYDQSIAGFLDHIMKKNFAAFVEQARIQTRHPVAEFERVGDDAGLHPLDDILADDVDTLIVISFDSLRTNQNATDSEIHSIGAFLAAPGNLLVVAPHHDIGHPGASHPDPDRGLEAEFFHHGDRTIPPRQGFGGYGRSLLAGLGVPVENRFGLHPASEPDGTPAPVDIEESLDRLGILHGVTTFNMHPHLPHFERLGDAVEKMDVLARQRIDPNAPPHPFTQNGRSTFDALLQSKPGVFAGDVLVGDSTLWSSTNGGVDSLRRLWTNVIERVS